MSSMLWDKPSIKVWQKKQNSLLACVVDRLDFSRVSWLGGLIQRGTDSVMKEADMTPQRLAGRPKPQSLYYYSCKDLQAVCVWILSTWEKPLCCRHPWLR